MSEHHQETESSKGKYQRTISLNQDINDRLLRVCEHMGVTPSAYLKQVIGEAVSRHEVSLLPKQSADAAGVMMSNFFESLASVVASEQDREEKDVTPD